MLLLDVRQMGSGVEQRQNYEHSEQENYRHSEAQLGSY